MKVGFIGLGRMGGHMCSNVIKAGFETYVSDLVPALVEQKVAEGAIGCKDNLEVAANMDIGFTMLPNGAIVEAVMCGPKGVLAHCKPGTIIVDMSSVAPGTTQKMAKVAAEHGVTLPELSLSADQVKDTITGFLQEKGDSVVNTTLNITTSILSALVNFLLALVFCLYLLAQKETLLAQSKRLLRRSLPQKAADRLLRLLSLSNNAFSSFVSGQVTEAVILGTLCCLGMLILRLPYALPVSVIIAALSLIPIFGAWIGAATGAFLIVFQSPIKALWFVLFVLVLQQLDGNVIGPKILGNTTGLSSFWVLFAILLFGGLWGFVGMIVGVPLFAVIYDIIKKLVIHGLQRHQELTLLNSYHDQFGDPADDAAAQPAASQPAENQ